MFLAYLGILLISIVLLRFLSRTSLIYALKKLWRIFEDGCYVYQFYRVPKFNENMQENHLYMKVYKYLNSLPAVEDSDFANLFSTSKSTEITVLLDDNQTIVDNFLGARVYWKVDNFEKGASKSLDLKMRRNDKRRILVPYFQHIHQVFDEIEQKRKEVRLFVHVDTQVHRNGRWRSTSFTHPATMETIVMDSDLKTRIKSDLDTFLKSKQYYHRLGKVWKRSYLLYGSAGTGKSTFIAAMAKFLGYDIYEINLHRISSDSDLKYLLLQTTNKSLLVVEDLDRYLGEKSTAVSLSGILNFMDGVISSCGEERVMIFTMNSKENIDTSFLRPGRIDVHIHFPLCDFTAFKYLANSHLGLKDHKLFSQVEENFQIGATLSPAEIGEIMVSNRGSPTRALKAVITALQGNLASRVGRRLSGSASSRDSEELLDSGAVAKDGQNGSNPIKNLYGLLRARSSRKASMEKLDMYMNEREKSDLNTA